VKRRLVRLLAVGAALAVLFAGAQPDVTAAPRTSTSVVAVSETAIGFALHPSGVVYVVEQVGRLRPFRGTKLGPAVLDVSKKVSSGGEQGLLGAAFSNDGKWLYTNLTNRSGDTEISAWPFVNGKAVTARRKVLLRVDQPFANHNGGHLVVDRAGVLWVGLGDGGSGGDPGKRAQNLDVLLGKILRIIPTPNARSPYTVPTGNVDSSAGRPEIWASGLRNPWTFALDEQRGRVWIADVGQNAWEEIDMVTFDTPTPNFGWPLREGRHGYENGDRPTGSIDPIHDYAHGSESNEGCSVTGGVVIPSGEYLYSDYCTGHVWALGMDGNVRSYSDTKVNGPAGFAVDATGAVLVAARGEGVLRLDSP
jgi:glucose/arabinose dehydrogenase